MRDYDYTDIETAQGAGSKTFHLPPSFLEDEISLPVLWDWHLDHSPDHPLFHYDDADGHIKVVYWAEAVRATHRAAHKISALAEEHGLPRGDTAKPPVIGILAAADAVTYWAVITGAIRAGYQPFMISTRNSSAAVAHLLNVSKSEFMLVSADSAMQDLAAAALGALDRKIMQFPMLRHDELYGENLPFERLPPYEISDHRVPALILHSSGSTAFPKIRVLTHNTMVQWGMITWYQTSDYCGNVMGIQLLPMFHMMGIMSSIAWPTVSGLVLSVFRPESPPIIPTPQKVLAAAAATKSDRVLTVPIMLEAWSKEPDAIETMKAFKYVDYAGGPLPKSIGDYLTEKGVNIRTAYGTTEFGAVTKLTTEPMGADWEYFQFYKQGHIHLERQDYDPRLYEVIVVNHPRVSPVVTNTEVNGVPAYASSDVLIEHPTRKGFWKVFGRIDDQIIHTTGEKTNPAPLEAIIKSHPAVQDAIMFGRARFQTGVIVQPAPNRVVKPDDVDALIAFRNEIWPKIEEANAFAPTHSRLFKEMIVVASPAKPFEYTAKMTPKRQAILNDYSDEVDGVYDAVEESSMKDLPAPKSWSESDSLEFVRVVVTTVMSKEDLGVDDDIFQHGADSLQATSIRNALLRALRESEIPVSGIPQNFVYTQPTISSLAAFVSQVARGEGDGISSSAVAAATAQVMKALVAELSSGFPQHRPSAPPPNAQTVLVTGTTGNVGALVLAKLIESPTVVRVYALNRSGKSGSGTLRERHVKAFEGQGLDIALLDSSKIVLLEGDASLPRLGLSQALYDETVQSVTSIIHVAWRVDFNVALSSFKPLVKGVRNLVDFALASPHPEPPRLVFASSVAAVQGWPSSEANGIPEVVSEDPTVAIGNGYGESKWVSERILTVAGEQTHLKPVIARVGQLSGNSATGAWNATEWFPALVQSSKIVGCLPRGEGGVDWLPIDKAAQVLIDLSTVTAQAQAITAHVVNPSLTSLEQLMTSLSSLLGVPIVPFNEWLSKLERVAENSAGAASAPALSLIDFYRRIGGRADGGDIRVALSGGRQFATRYSSAASVTLRGAAQAQLDAGDAKRWVQYWQSLHVL